MTKPNLGLRLRDKLGPEASQDLTNAFEEGQTDMLTITAERFEGRLAAVGSGLREDMVRMDSGVRIALAEGLSKIRADISEARERSLLVVPILDRPVRGDGGAHRVHAEMARALKRVSSEDGLREPVRS